VQHRLSIWTHAICVAALAQYVMQFAAHDATAHELREAWTGHAMNART